eukprot:1861819-Pyramimonas_sp.AAC.1
MAPALQWSKMIWHAVAFPSDALVGLTELERMWDRVFPRLSRMCPGPKLADRFPGSRFASLA